LKTTFAERAFKYFSRLSPPDNLPGEITILNPYKKPEVKNAVQKFFNKYFDDNKKRIFVFGINPGRFGGGLTGISFTDPVALRNDCEIENDLGDRKELSSKFIYKMISEYGGVRKFYSDIFITAIYPLAIIRDGKNFNYYDTPSLVSLLKPQIKKSVKEQFGFGARIDFAVSLGKKNAKYLKEINDELHLFNEIKVLDHPRYIMQYKLKKIDYYLDEYINMLTL